MVTGNTSRIGGSDPASDAAAVARSVYPGLTSASPPEAVVLVDEGDWHAALAASVLASAPLGAPLIFSSGGWLPGVSSEALGRMQPARERARSAGAQVIRVGASASAPGRPAQRDASPDGRGGRPRRRGRAPAGARPGRQPHQVIVVPSTAPLCAS